MSDEELGLVALGRIDVQAGHLITVKWCKAAAPTRLAAQLSVD